MSQVFYFLYQEFLLEGSHTIENMNFLTNAVQDLFVGELQKFGGSHQKGKKNKIISKFQSVNDLENYTQNLLDLFDKFKDSNKEHDFQCVSFVCVAAQLDQSALVQIKEASSVGLRPHFLYSSDALALSKYQDDKPHSKYFQYKRLEESQVQNSENNGRGSYKAIAPKIFGVLILIVLLIQIASMSIKYMSNKFDDVRYSKLDQALIKGDSFSLYQNALKFDEDQVDDKFSYYVDQLVKSSITKSDFDVVVDYIVLKERIYGLETKLKSFPAVRLYSNLIGLYEKSIEGEISFHEINQLLTQSKSLEQQYIILILSLDFNVKKFQLIPKAAELNLKEDDRAYILTLLFQASLEERIDGRYEYYKSLIENQDDPDLELVLQKNLLHPNLKVRQNSYKLLVKFQKLESYQFSQFINFELDHSRDYILLCELISTHYIQSLKKEIFPKLELIYKKAKRAKADDRTLNRIQELMVPFKTN